MSLHLKCLDPKIRFVNILKTHSSVPSFLFQLSFCTFLSFSSLCVFFFSFSLFLSQEGLHTSLLLFSVFSPVSILFLSVGFLLLCLFLIFFLPFLVVSTFLNYGSYVFSLFLTLILILLLSGRNCYQNGNQMLD
jgi:hypothetical protein